ncbi:cation:proton antiporter domain-containing protein [Neisseria yangbaofengii]|uniref:cation:proton antiporter domain-containing protein n=1 Tax=Neisseria yangbaofengii TaxID=2709396 RepID=UPI003531130A
MGGGCRCSVIYTIGAWGPGHLVSGLLIGPFGLKLFNDAHAAIHFAELGVVMFLFSVGFEMQPKHLRG